VILTKFDIGQRVWAASTSGSPTRMVCPDCLGERVWACTLPNGEHINIECPTCNYGFDGSRGTVEGDYSYSADVHEGIVSKIAANTFDEEVNYTILESGRYFNESVVFSSEAEARACAASLASEIADRVRIQNIEHRARKRKDHPGSRVSYLRREVTNKRKEIERTLEHISNLQQQHPRMKIAEAK